MTDNGDDKPKGPWNDKKPAPEVLKKILADHKAWVEAGAKGDPPVDLSGINLSYCLLSGVILKHANLSNANLEKVNPTNSLISYVNFRNANLRHANLSGSEISFSDLRETILAGTVMEGTNVWRVKFDNETKCSGIRVAGTHGSPRFKRFAQDQDYLEEHQEYHPK